MIPLRVCRAYFRLRVCPKQAKYVWIEAFERFQILVLFAIALQKIFPDLERKVTGFHKNLLYPSVQPCVQMTRTASAKVRQKAIR
jgi:hypothetical protein